MDAVTEYTHLKGSIHALTVALHERDPHTRQHCDRVAELSQALGRACGVPAREMYALGLSARFHDIGKIGVPDRVLLKPGDLTAEEWALMKAHSGQGERIFRGTELDCAEEVATIIRHHHEAYDGSGYPDGLRGERIPLASRVLQVADAYDAIGTARPYHRSRDHRETVRIMRSERGTKFDPAILDFFLGFIDQSPARIP